MIKGLFDQRNILVGGSRLPLDAPGLRAPEGRGAGRGAEPGPRGAGRTGREGWRPGDWGGAHPPHSSPGPPLKQKGRNGEAGTGAGFKSERKLEAGNENRNPPEAISGLITVLLKILLT